MRYDVDRALGEALDIAAPPLPLDAIRMRARVRAVAQRRRTRGSMAVIAAMLVIVGLMAVMVDRVWLTPVATYGVSTPMPIPTES